MVASKENLMEIIFSNEFPDSKTDEVVDYLRGPRLWMPHVHLLYPDLYDWLHKVHHELSSGKKRALIASWRGDIIGVIIYQRHMEERNALELKNLTVRPDKRGRHLASFLLRNAEIEGAYEFHTTSILCDAKRSNYPIRQFLLVNHYTIHHADDLYGLGGGEDIIYKKVIHTLRQ